MGKIKILSTAEPQFEQEFKTLLQRQVETVTDVEAIVKTILRDVKKVEILPSLTTLLNMTRFHWTKTPFWLMRVKLMKRMKVWTLKSLLI